MSSADRESRCGVFICFSYSALERVQSVVNEIQNAGVDCWICTEKIGGGDKLRDEVAQAITNCKVCLCMISQKFADSEECRKEVALAEKLGKFIIPVIIEDVPWPPVKTNGSPTSLSVVLIELLYHKLPAGEDVKELIQIINRELENTADVSTKRKTSRSKKTIDKPNKVNEISKSSSWDVSTKRKNSRSKKTIDKPNKVNEIPKSSSWDVSTKCKKGKKTIDKPNKVNEIPKSSSLDHSSLSSFAMLKAELVQYLSCDNVDSLADLFDLKMKEKDEIKRSGIPFITFMDKIVNSAKIDCNNCSNLSKALRVLNLEVPAKLIDDYQANTIKEIPAKSASKKVKRKNEIPANSASKRVKRKDEAKKKLRSNAGVDTIGAVISGSVSYGRLVVKIKKVQKKRKIQTKNNKKCTIRNLTISDRSRRDVPLVLFNKEAEMKFKEGWTVEFTRIRYEKEYKQLQTGWNNEIKVITRPRK